MGRCPLGRQPPSGRRLCGEGPFILVELLVGDNDSVQDGRDGMEAWHVLIHSKPVRTDGRHLAGLGVLDTHVDSDGTALGL